MKTYFVTPHLCLNETALMIGPNLKSDTENYLQIIPFTPSYLEHCVALNIFLIARPVNVV